MKMTAKEIKIGNTRVIIKTDYCVQSREEVEQILRDIGRIVTDSENRRVQNAE